MKNKIITLICLIIALLIWLFKPVYDWAAYRGKAPILFASHYALPNSPLPETSHAHSETKLDEAKLINILKKYREQSHAPGLSAAIAYQGKPLWSGTVGYASLENNIPLTTEHQFRIGSTSKAMTATLLAQLIDKHNFNLDTPIQDYLGFNPNPLWPAMTPRQLASHSAGLPHYKRNTDLMGLYYAMALTSHFETPLEALKGFDGSELLYSPGEQFYYSSYGTVLLSSVLAAASGQDFIDAMRERIWQPLDMTQTGLEAEAEHLVDFYFNNKGQQTSYIPWRNVDLSHRLAGGGFISTPSDLVKLGSGYLDRHFLNQTTVDTMWTPQQLSNGEINPQNYALGWREAKNLLLDKYTAYHHGGVSRGSQSMLIVTPELSLSIAANINVNTEVFWDFGEVVTALAEEIILQGITPAL